MGILIGLVVVALLVAILAEVHDMRNTQAIHGQALYELGQLVRRRNKAS